MLHMPHTVVSVIDLNMPHTKPSQILGIMLNNHYDIHDIIQEVIC